MGDFTDFERGQIVGMRLTRPSMRKTACTLLGVSRVIVSKVMSTYMNHGKTISMKRNSASKSTLAESDRLSYIE
jgi:hypothetical protein